MGLSNSNTCNPELAMANAVSPGRVLRHQVSFWPDLIMLRLCCWVSNWLLEPVLWILCKQWNMWFIKKKIVQMVTTTNKKSKTTCLLHRIESEHANWIMNNAFWPNHSSSKSFTCCKSEFIFAVNSSSNSFLFCSYSAMSIFFLSRALRGRECKSFRG